jgi:hypothetical protein
MIQRKLDQGSCGKIYKCNDLENIKKPLVIKLSKNHKILLNEIMVINAINN